ncbi:hypothetical protein TIFTF001_036715 [Ficus carica]|uniref:Uncharacterized protein n=1 Tax=Ficus carica TaxID=3494 RepID=A0AA88E4U4_FICCA|nr:hypothetical protein TIFTF001_036715 [Ficus carica]
MGERGAAARKEKMVDGGGQTIDGRWQCEGERVAEDRGRERREM